MSYQKQLQGHITKKRSKATAVNWSFGIQKNIQNNAFDFIKICLIISQKCFKVKNNIDAKNILLNNCVK